MTVTRAEFRSGLVAKLRLPVICAPMFGVSGLALARAAVEAGVVAAIPVRNAASLEQYGDWLAALEAFRGQRFKDGLRAGPVAVNLSPRMSAAHRGAIVDLARRAGVDLFISAAGDPGELTRQVQAAGGRLLHDVTSLTHARRAIDRGVDGLICIAHGGGGHSGHLNPFVFIPAVRRLFDGVVVLAGGVSDGAAVRAARALGADLAYVGTRFIATRESLAAEAYKQRLVESGAEDLIYSAAVTGIPGQWMQSSLRDHGLDAQSLGRPSAPFGRDHLPSGVMVWRDLWSAGQGIELIDSVPSLEEVVAQMEADYAARD